MAHIIQRTAKVAAALLLAAAVSGCVFVPVGGRYGYYRPHPHYFY